MKVSVVIPCYYSEALITKVVTLTRDELIEGGYDYEFILVNDGSTDGTFEKITQLCEQDENIVGIDCAKNLGQHNAIIAGLRYAEGDIIMGMDDDMQTHPSQCRKLLSALVEHDRDVVFASWKQHKEAWWRLLGSKFAVWSTLKLTDRPKEIYASNYYVMRKHVRDVIIQYKGPFVQIQGLIFQATANMENVEIEHFDREDGQSGYTFKALIKFWMTILNFSMVPLRAATVLGFVMGFGGLIAAIAIVIRKVLDPAMAAGWPSLMAVLLVCSGIILLSLGITGEYLGRIFKTINHEPQYVLKKIVDNRSQE